jgi:hypothetical protein
VLRCNSGGAELLHWPGAQGGCSGCTHTGWPGLAPFCRMPRLPPQRARDIPSRPVLRFRPNPTPGPAGGLPQPQPGTRPSLARRGPIFQSITRFGMTGWDGDPTTGSPDLHSPPRGWSPAAGSARKAPSCFVGARYALEIASVQLRRRVPHYKGRR